MVEEQQDLFRIVYNKHELLKALKLKTSYITIDKSFEKTFINESQLPFTEEESMGFDLGTRGYGGIFMWLIRFVIDLFLKEEKIQRKIDRKLTRYTLKDKQEGLLLYLSQFNY